MAATKALLWIAEELFSEGWRTVYLTSLNNNSLEVDCVLVRFCPKVYSFVPRNHFPLCGLQTEMLSIQQMASGLKKLNVKETLKVSLPIVSYNCYRPRKHLNVSYTDQPSDDVCAQMLTKARGKCCDII